MVKGWFDGISWFDGKGSVDLFLYFDFIALFEGSCSEPVNMPEDSCFLQQFKSVALEASKAYW